MTSQSGISRRRLLRLAGAVGLGAAGAAALAACAPDTSGRASTALPEGEFLGSPVEPLAGIEKPQLTVGYIPITCASPIVLADPLNFYAKHGLQVTLRKYGGWADIRDAYIAGEVDASHLLSPMPLAISEGYGSARVPTRLAAMGNVNGQAITLATEHAGRVAGPADLRGMTLGVPFDFSMHNFLLRHYLTTGGLDPDRDVQIQVVRPPDMVAQLVSGNIDGYLGPDPFNQRAVFQGAGFIHVLTRDLWAGHPCCGFAVQESFAAANPVTYRALLRAVSDSAQWANAAANRVQAAGAMAPQAYLNQPPEVVQAVLTGEFDDGSGTQRQVADRIGFEPFPWQNFAVWMLAQMQRWELAPAGTYATASDLAAAAARVFDTATAREAMAAVGSTPPADDARVEQVMGTAFDPADPMRWTERFVA